jgi:hypothetical protein
MNNIIHSTVNHFVEGPHSGAVIHYNGYVEPRDGAMSVLLSSQQEAVACVWCIQEESHCCERVVICEQWKSRMSQFEQRVNINFCPELGKSAIETFQMVKQTYGKQALESSVVFKWHKRFPQGRDGLEDDKHMGWPRTVRTELTPK